MDELHPWLILARAPGVHAGALLPLLEQFETLDAIITAKPVSLAAAGLSAQNIAAIINPDSAQLERDRRWLSEAGNAFIPFGDPRYPPLVAQLNDAPIGLFVRGHVDCLTLPQLAIV